MSSIPMSCKKSIQSERKRDLIGRKAVASRDDPLGVDESATTKHFG